MMSSRMPNTGCINGWRTPRTGLDRGGSTSSDVDGLFTQSVHGDGSDDLRVPGADLVSALDPLGLVVLLQSRRDQRSDPIGDDLVAGGADMKRVIKDLALGGIEHVA
jgi:hypothetical protein